MNRKNHARNRGTLLLCLAVILWTAFIWNNSAKPAVESAGQSLQVLEQLKYILSVLDLDEDVLHFLVRKSAHVLEFAVLGALLAAFTGRQWQTDQKFALLLAFTLGLMTAVIDETIQLAYDGRAGMVQDLWVDLSGVLLGMILAQLIFASVKTKRR